MTDKLGGMWNPKWQIDIDRRIFYKNGGAPRRPLTSCGMPLEAPPLAKEKPRPVDPCPVCRYAMARCRCEEQE